jgi:hypothetical protein
MEGQSQKAEELIRQHLGRLTSLRALHNIKALSPTYEHSGKLAISRFTHLRKADPPIALAFIFDCGTDDMVLSVKWYSQG